MICSDFSTDVLKFYNSHSLIHSREVFYSFKIIPPEFEFTGAIIDEESADPMHVQWGCSHTRRAQLSTYLNHHFITACRILCIVRQTQVENLHSPTVYFSSILTQEARLAHMYTLLMCFFNEYEVWKFAKKMIIPTEEMYVYLCLMVLHNIKEVY